IVSRFDLRLRALRRRTKDVVVLSDDDQDWNVNPLRVIRRKNQRWKGIEFANGDRLLEELLDRDDLRLHMGRPKQRGAGSGKCGQITIRDILPGKTRVIIGRINNRTQGRKRRPGGVEKPSQDYPVYIPKLSRLDDGDS